MGKFIEIGVTFVDRDVDPVQSRTLGFVQFDVDTAKIVEPNPLDAKAIAILRAYLKAHDAEVTALEKKLKV